MQLKRIKENFGEKFSIFSKNYKNCGDYTSKQRGELIALFAKYQPELVTRQTLSVTHQRSSEVVDDNNHKIVKREDTEIRV
ncbi:MAG: hypothetical protein ACOC07_14340, partial [Coleofasciculus sp.]